MEENLDLEGQEEIPTGPFVPPVDDPTQLPLAQSDVLEIVKIILDPQGLQKLQFTEINASWIRDLVITDITNYAQEIVKHGEDMEFDWASLNKALGYRDYDGILNIIEIAQYSLARWQRAYGRKLIKDAHELALSSKEETDEAKLLRTGFKG